MEQTRTTFSRMWREEETDILMWALVVLALVAGLLVRGAVVNQTQSYSGPSLSLSYPERWADQTQPGQLLSVAESLGASIDATTLQVEQQPLAATGTTPTLGEAVLAWTAQRGKDLTAYRVLGTSTGSLKGVPASWVDYAYVQSHGAGGASSLPVVMRAQSLLVQRGGQLVAVTFATPADGWANAAEQWQAIQNSIVFK